MILKKTLLSTAIFAATLGLTACGGSDSNDNNNNSNDSDTTAPANTAPSDITLSAAVVNDDVIAGEVGTLSATDDTDSGLTFTLADDEDRFEIVNDTTLKLKSGIALNFEQEAQVTVAITVIDAGGLSFSKELDVSVTDIEAVKDNTMSFVPADSVQKSFADISSSGKELSGKVTGEDAAKMYKDWLVEGTFLGWTDFGTQAKTPEGLVYYYFDLLAANIDKHNSGEVITAPAGNPITNLYITAQGLDLNQLIQKHTLGAVMFSQGTDDYLEQGLETDNITSQKDGTLYTALEHQFDEGFGYFGAARNYLEYSDDEIAAKDGRDEFKAGYNDYSSDGQIDLASEYNWGNSTNAAKRDRGAEVRTDFTAAAMNAFISARKLINEAVGTALTDEQMAEIAGVSYEGFDLALAGKHVPSRTVVDLAAGYDLVNYGQIYLKLDNLFDDDKLVSRRPYGARPSKPRTLTVGYKFSF